MHCRSCVILAAVVLAVGACAKSEPPKDTTAAMTPPPAPAPAKTISLADVAGRWNVETRAAAGSKDTMVTKAVLVATADTTGWVLELPTGKKVANHVTVSGDSIMMKSDTYASMRRKGKQVWSESVVRLENGKLVGTTTGHYSGGGPDSVLTFQTEGTKQ